MLGPAIAWCFLVALADPPPRLVRIVRPEEANVLVFSPAGFDGELQRWIDFRNTNGHRIAVLRPTSFDEMRGAVRATAQFGKLQTVVLIGDAPDRLHPVGQPFGALETPTGYVAADINVRFGSEPWIASDNALADLDGDHLPDLTIGRIAVRDPQSFRVVVDKLIRYETEQPQSQWRRRINLVAGVGGFGAVADSVLELSTKRFVVEGIPSCYDASMTYGSWQSAYCPAPPRFRDSTIERFNDGCLFWIYIGHGSPGSVAPLETPLGRYRVLSADDAQHLESREGLPIAIFLACYTAAYDYNSQGDCLAEEMLARPSGPVAVLGASRVSMPYAMAVMSNELMNEYFSYHHATLGELFREAKRLSVDESAAADNSQRAMLDGLAGIFSPTRNELSEERHENLYLFNLIGDPLTRLVYPQDVQLEPLPIVRSGDTITVKGNSPIAGRMVLDLSYRRDRLTVPFAGRSAYDDSDPSLDEFDATYRKANDRTVVVHEIQVAPGPFEQTIQVPDWARGAATIRAFVQGDTSTAIGSYDLTLRQRR